MVIILWIVLSILWAAAFPAYMQTHKETDLWTGYNEWEAIAILLYVIGIGFPIFAIPTVLLYFVFLRLFKKKE